jgi:hypothetical protein
MLDQGLPSGSRVPYSLNGEGALRQALDGSIDGGPRKSCNTRDQGDTSSSQSLAVECSDQVLLTLIEVRKQQCVLPLKFFSLTHPGIITSPLSFVTANILQTLKEIDVVP